MKKALTCAVVLLLAPVAGHADSIVDAMRDFGLMGTWASACNEDAGPANSHATYLVATGERAQLKTSAGADYEDSTYDIQDAKRVDGDKLLVRQALQGNDRVVLDVTLLKDNNRIKSGPRCFPTEPRSSRMV